MGLFDQTIGILARSLDLRTSGHKALSSNIANAETPNYRSKSIPFQKILESSIDRTSTISLVQTHAAHFAAEFETPVEMESSTEGVNIDQEMAKLAENNLMFQAGVQALVKKLEALKTTITEGGR
jgi:flagellar basal-body rod protein FlgB